MNLKKVIGGNGFLSENGRKYASALGEYIQSTVDVTNTKFITSTLNRTLQTARLANISVHDQVNIYTTYMYITYYIRIQIWMK